MIQGQEQKKESSSLLKHSFPGQKQRAQFRDQDVNFTDYITGDLDPAVVSACS